MCKMQLCFNVIRDYWSNKRGKTFHHSKTYWSTVEYWMERIQFKRDYDYVYRCVNTGKVIYYFLHDDEHTVYSVNHERFLCDDYGYIQN